VTKKTAAMKASEKEAAAPAEVSYSLTQLSKAGTLGTNVIPQYREVSALERLGKNKCKTAGTNFSVCFRQVSFLAKLFACQSGGILLACHRIKCN
jgi:hypothetical protein